MTVASRPAAIAWNWSDALRGAVCVAPAAVVALWDVAAGLALAVGVLPATIVALPAVRRRRWSLALVGALVGIPIVVGSALANVPVLAVAAIVLLAVASVLLTHRRPPLGRVLMVLGLPMIGVGLSYTDVGEAAGLAALMLVGSVFAAAVSMLWPEGPTAQATADVGRPPTIEYGVRLGLAGGTAAAIGFAADLDHVGWATAACLLVMRPDPAAQRLRSIGRLAAVLLGALAAAGIAHLTPVSGWYAVVVVLVLAVAAGTHASRWYVTPCFTTFIVISLLVQSDPDAAAARFGERVGETVLGVAIAFVFGPVVGGLIDRRRACTVAG